MEAAQLNASELSARTGISVSYMSRIIQGEVVNPTIDFVTRIAEGLGVTESELLRGDGEEKYAGRKEKQNQNVVGHGRGLKSGTQVKHTPLPTIANPAVAIPWKAIPDAPLGTTEEEMDEIVSLIDSASLSDEEEERINATLFEIAKQLLSLIEVQRKMRKED
jgi:transcriptional regulator with XRE-family HTH domain